MKSNEKLLFNGVKESLVFLFFSFKIDQSLFLVDVIDKEIYFIVFFFDRMFRR